MSCGGSRNTEAGGAMFADASLRPLTDTYPDTGETGEVYDIELGQLRSDESSKAGT